MELIVSIEINGKQTDVGNITGASVADATFSYSTSYLNTPGVKAISISLPLERVSFTPAETRNFFEGLLPEGFSRRAVSNWIKADELDYLSILRVLGRECIGAIRVRDVNDSIDESHYEKLSEGKIKTLAAEGASTSTAILMETHLSLAGATGKVGLYFDGNDWYLPKGLAASTHIVKQSHVRLEHIVQNELFCMRTAQNLGIDTINSFILDVGTGADEDILYATQRYDRVFGNNILIDKLPVPYRLHQEDFAMAMGIASSAKYEQEDSGYLQKMFDLIVKNSSNPLEDQLKLWDLIVLNYLIGNNDSHIKNYSLLYSNDMKGIRFAPAYDIVCTMAYPSSENLSYFIGGELNINKITRSHFQNATEAIALSSNIAMKRFDELANKYEAAVSTAYNELSNDGLKNIESIKNSMISKGGYSQL